MNQYSLSEPAMQYISESVSSFNAQETAGLSRECSKLALQNIVNSNFDQAHFYFALAKEFMLLAARRKEEMLRAASG